MKCAGETYKSSRKLAIVVLNEGVEVYCSIIPLPVGTLKRCSEDGITSVDVYSHISGRCRESPCTSFEIAIIVAENIVQVQRRFDPIALAILARRVQDVSFEVPITTRLSERHTVHAILVSPRPHRLGEYLATYVDNGMVVVGL